MQVVMQLTDKSMKLSWKTIFDRVFANGFGSMHYERERIGQLLQAEYYIVVSSTLLYYLNCFGSGAIKKC